MPWQVHGMLHLYEEQKQIIGYPLRRKEISMKMHFCTLYDMQTKIHNIPEIMYLSFATKAMLTKSWSFSLEVASSLTSRHSSSLSLVSVLTEYGTKPMPVRQDRDAEH